MIEIVAETGSTNADMLERLRNGVPVAEGHWLIADRQTHGRGRQGRHWLDAPGNFMGSTMVQYSPKRDPSPASLGFVASLAVYEALVGQISVPQALQLKWPNDVMLSGGKMCGLLLEREGESVVIGIGVNLAIAPEVDGRKVVAASEGGAAFSRDQFAEKLSQQLATELQRWRDFGLESIFRRWTSAAHPIGTPLTVHGDGGEVVEGKFHNLDHDGALILRLPNGSTRVIHAGDVMLEN